MSLTQSSSNRAKRRELRTPVPEKPQTESRKQRKLVSVESPAPEIMTQPRRGLALAIGFGALLLCLAIYLLRLDHVAGLYGDDAWYILLAKAMATGHGYTLINSPSPGIMPFYPPAFSFLLSLIFRIAPEFPQNVWLLKSVSITAMIGVGMAAYHYFARVRALPFHLALSLAVAIVIHPALTFLATSTLMSECVFTCAQLLTIVVIELAVSKSRIRLAWHYVLLGALLASITFLVRSTGLALLAAIMLYLLKERLTRAAVIFALGVAVLVGPWMIYTRIHAPTPAQQAEQNSYIVESYATQFWQKQAGFGPFGTITLSDIPERMLNNAFHILEYDSGALLAYPVYRALEPTEGKKREVKTALLSLTLFLLAATGFVAAVRERMTVAELLAPFTLMMILLWSFSPFRFLLPLLPWAMLYVAYGVRAIYRLGRRMSRISTRTRQMAVIGSVVGVLAAISLYGNVTYIIQLHGPQAQRPHWVRAYDENVAMYRWMGEHLPKEAAIAAQNPALLYLYTGHKTVGSWEPAKHWEDWKQMGVRYLSITASHQVDEPSKAEKRFPIIYNSEWLKLHVLDFGEASSRKLWIDNP